MKKTYLLLFLSIFIVSCSSDDNNDGDNNGTPGDPFLPTGIGNYWVYDVDSSLADGRDSLYIAKDTIIDGNTFQKLKTKEQPFGFFSNALNNNSIRHSDGKIFLTGKANLNFSEDLPFDISVSNFVIFNQNASANESLGTVSGVFEQEIEGFLIKFKYTLASKAKADLATYASGQENYTNVKPVEITLNLEITASMAGFPIEYPIMKPQNVVTSTQYYAQNIGVVHTTTDITYSLEEIPLPDFQLPIPQSGTEHQEETLVNYNIE
ncbi:hypothetical protein D3C87_127440 [compost metagenome]